LSNANFNKTTLVRGTFNRDSLKDILFGGVSNLDLLVLGGRYIMAKYGHS
jgi:hypothetical protein